MKTKNVINAAISAIVLAGLYFLTRYGLPNLYTPEWGARRIYWIVAIVVFLPVLFGKIRFSTVALAGYIVGLVAGELFGGFESDVPPQFRHHGWSILILTFLAACVIGFLVEKLSKKRRISD